MFRPLKVFNGLYIHQLCISILSHHYELYMYMLIDLCQTYVLMNTDINKYFTNHPEFSKYLQVALNECGYFYVTRDYRGQADLFHLTDKLGTEHFINYTAL